MRKIVVFYLSLLCLVPMMLFAEEAGVHRFANYNIRYVNASNGDTGEKLWANRRTYVVRNITSFDFDIVGMEEVTGNNKDATTGKSQLQDLRDMLTGYADYSVEREGNEYSYNSIFYKKSKYTVIDKGFFYLNEHPQTPGVGWGSDIARTCIWIHFRDNSSGQDFYFVCTHLNWGATESGIQSAKLIGQRIHDLVGQTPMVLVGDFNMVRSEHEEAYRGYAAHFYDLALTTPVNQCLPASGPQITATTTQWTPAVNQSSGQEYDYIFYDHMEPLSRHIITEYYPEYGRTVNPSDHYPVMGRFRLGSPVHPTVFRATNVTSLNTALASATHHDTILLAAGNYTITKAIVPTCSMTISGGWNTSFTDQTGMSSIVANSVTNAVINIPHYYELNLDHVEISGGNNTSIDGGGAIYSCGQNLTLNQCYFHANTASAFGGAVMYKGENLLIDGCVFEGNTSSAGGAVWCQLRDLLKIRGSRFEGNSVTNAGGALVTQGFNLLDIQQCAFLTNASATHGALDISPAEAPSAAHLLNCSFMNNTISAKKGLASVTKRYGGAGLWADMAESTIPLNIGHCTFLGNHVSFNGTETNIGGGALAIFKGKVCLMNSIILGNDLTIEGSTPVWKDLHTITNDVNIWRNTYNLTSTSSEISGWENTISATFGGAISGGKYSPQIKADGTYPIYQKTLSNYHFACLPTNQRLCESAFTYDLNGDGVISGYVSRDQVNLPRTLQSCIGAVEYNSTDSNTPLLDTQCGEKPLSGCIYSISGQNMGVDMQNLPPGIYIINGMKIIR